MQFLSYRRSTMKALLLAAYLLLITLVGSELPHPIISTHTNDVFSVSHDTLIYLAAPQTCVATL